MALGERISRFVRGSESGATAVEFVILLPIMMVCFGAIVEGSRIYWNYQAAVSGVRDAARYVARTTPADICNGTTNPFHVTLPGGADRAREIIDRNLGTGDENLFPLSVFVHGVMVTYACPDLDLATDPTPVARVEAVLDIYLPFGEVFEIFGARTTPKLVSVITDQSRIYGI